MEELQHGSNHVMNMDQQSSIPIISYRILQWISEYTNDVIVILDQSGRIQHISESVKHILNYQPASLLHLHWKDFILNEEAMSHLNVINDIEKIYTFPVQIPNLQDKNIPFQCKMSKIKTDKEIVYIGILKESTNEQEFDELLVRQEKMSIAGQLAAGIAHEIRNPLTSLRGFIQLLQAGMNQRDAYYKILLDEIEKIETITTELLSITKPTTNDKKYESLDSMIKDVIFLLKPQARLHDISLVFEEIHEDFHIYCDRSQIKQVFINLIKNAIEASEKSSHIYIEVYQERENILIDIIDEGKGIPIEMLHKLDEPFFTTKQTGTGLGLMITKNILHEHQSHMEIIQNKTKGSTFRILIPQSKKRTK